MSIFRILKVVIIKINKLISLLSGKEQYLTKETKKLAPCILHPASDCLSTENRLFPNKTSFQASHNSPASSFKKISAWVQASLCTSVEILYCSSYRLNLKPSKFSNFVLRYQLHTIPALQTTAPLRVSQPDLRLVITLYMSPSTAETTRSDFKTGKQTWQWKSEMPSQSSVQFFICQYVIKSQFGIQEMGCRPSLIPVLTSLFGLNSVFI